MADMKKEVNEVMDDLKQKIENITDAAEYADDASKIKVDEVKEKAVKVLSTASDKIADAYKNISNPEELEKSLDLVKHKSKDLYDKTMRKIDELKKSQAYSNTMDYVRKTAYQVKDETIDFFEGTKNNIDDFLAKPEVKDSIDKAKLKTVDIAEKALDTLKQWLKPEDGNK